MIRFTRAHLRFITNAVYQSRDEEQIQRCHGHPKASLETLTGGPALPGSSALTRWWPDQPPPVGSRWKSGPHQAGRRATTHFTWGPARRPHALPLPYSTKEKGNPREATTASNQLTPPVPAGQCEGTFGHFEAGLGNEQSVSGRCAHSSW